MGITYEDFCKGGRVHIDKLIAEEPELIGNGYTRLHIKNEKVIFEHISFVEQGGMERNFARGIMSINNYKEGIKELKEKGECVIVGDDCTLKLCKREYGSSIWMSVDFTGEGVGNSIEIWDVAWLVHDLSL